MSSLRHSSSGCKRMQYFIQYAVHVTVRRSAPYKFDIFCSVLGVIGLNDPAGILRHHGGRNDEAVWDVSSCASLRTTSCSMKRFLTAQSRRSFLTTVHPPSPTPRRTPRQDSLHRVGTPTTRAASNPIGLVPRRKCNRRSLSSSGGGGGIAAQAEGAQGAAAAAEVVPEPSYAELRALAIATAV
jgi:hypothetical protein